MKSLSRVGAEGHGVKHLGGSCFLGLAGEALASDEDNQQQVISFELDFSALDQFKQDFPA